MQIQRPLLPQSLPHICKLCDNCSIQMAQFQVPHAQSVTDTHNATHVLSQAMGFFVVGWLPSLLLIVWQGGILPLGLYLLVQVCVLLHSCSTVQLLYCIAVP